jgi:hypothetical protein
LTLEFPIPSRNQTTPLYVNRLSNHPPSIIQNIPAAVNLSSISANEEVFNSAAAPNQKALNGSGYYAKLEFQPAQGNKTKKPNRGRKIPWFNPPSSSNVSTNIWAKFLKMRDTCFPLK